MNELTNEWGVDWAMSNDTNRIKPKYSQKNLPQCHVINQNLTHTGLELNPNLCSDRTRSIAPAMVRPFHTGVLINPDQEGKKLMFLSEWREFPSVPCLAGKKKTWWQFTSRCWNRARPWHASELVSFLVGLRTYQHPGTSKGVSPYLIFRTGPYLTFRTGPYLTFHLLRVCFHSSFPISVKYRQRHCMATFRTIDG